MTYRDCVYPVVHITFVRQQVAVVEYLRDNHLHLFGDGHCDSPDYSAEYATYSLINSATHKAPVYYAQILPITVVWEKFDVKKFSPLVRPDEN